MNNKETYRLCLAPRERRKLRAHKVKTADITNHSIESLQSMLAVPEIRAMEIYALAEFQRIPSIGIKFAHDLISLGYYSLHDLKDQDGATLINDLEQWTGTWIDPCVEDQCRLVVHYANHPGSNKKWWDFTAERKLFRQQNGYPANRPQKPWYKGSGYIQRSAVTLFLLFFLCLANTNCQTAPANKQAQSDTSHARQLQEYRQHFRDSPPKATGWTTDMERLFTDAQKLHLDSLIRDYEKKTTVEIAIVTLDTNATSTDKFDDLALHISNTWGVGKKDKNNGVTICISKGYRRMRICNGYGIEKILSDDETKDIVDNDFIPSFKAGDYYKGTLLGLAAIMAKLDAKMK